MSRFFRPKDLLPGSHAELQQQPSLIHTAGLISTQTSYLWYSRTQDQSTNTSRIMDFEKLPLSPDCSEDIIPENLSTHRRRTWISSLWRPPFIAFLAGLLIGLTPSIYAYSTQTSSLWTTPTPPYDATQQVLELPHISRSFNLSDFNFPSPQPIEADIWHSSVPREMFLHIDDAVSAGLPPGIPLSTVQNSSSSATSPLPTAHLLHTAPVSTTKDELTAFYVPSVLHQLHCISYLRSAYILAAYNATNSPYEHVSHCFEFVREAITCNGDVTLEGHDEGRFTVAGGREARHSCLDLEALLEMMRKGEKSVGWDVNHIA